MAEAAGGGSDDAKQARSLETLPSAVLQTILLQLDLCSICSIASTCRTFRACAQIVFTHLPNFHLFDMAPTEHILAPLLPANSHLRSIKIDCCRLNDSAIDLLARPSLHELCLFNCGAFTGRLLYEIGIRCRDVRYLHLGSVAHKKGRAIDISDLEVLLRGCCGLETLTMGIDVSRFPPHNFACAWTLASPKLASLEIGYISSSMLTEMLYPTTPKLTHDNLRIPLFPNLQKLCLSVDYITDTMIGTVSDNLPSLNHLDLRDAPTSEPRLPFDLTNSGLEKINKNRKLKQLSLVRSQEFFVSYFRRINDLGILMMADRCSTMESISLGGFCRVTDTGFRAILHSSLNLSKLKISHGTNLTDLAFHDIAATTLSLTYISLRWCNLLSNLTVSHLTTSNTDLAFLDLRDCRSLGDDAVMAISNLSKLKILLLDGCDISDMGISHLKNSVTSSLVSLSLKGCKRLTDKCISALFGEASNIGLQELDLSALPNLTDNGILLLAKSQVPIIELRLKQCPFIGDTSVMALALHGSSLRVLDIYNCGRITSLAFSWLKKPYFPRLKWLGLTWRVNRDLVDALAWSWPHLHVACRGEVLGATEWDHYVQDFEEMGLSSGSSFLVTRRATAQRIY